ncbi:hypothetical protein BCR34DRAFT_600142 [Clohesyomyces aquaticus]|uniref:Uncharacterized protein n=1 Tax=Clohesyomyces aquaticus TaxID=1231657 RepID=A0A1Y1ZRY1_9PLEO|nr:hypothetical protein BCR34DRAFT_600142 [Clohesyomyces aquaticus]
MKSLAAVLGGTKEEDLASIDRLSTDHENALYSRQIDLVSGQQDLSQNLERACQNIRDALKARDDDLIGNLENVLREQGAATSFLLSHTNGAEPAVATAVQLTRLDTKLTRAIKAIEELRSEVATQKRPDSPRYECEKNKVAVRTSFGLSIRSNIISIHVSTSPIEYTRALSFNLIFMCKLIDEIQARLRSSCWDPPEDMSEIRQHEHGYEEDYSEYARFLLGTTDLDTYVTQSDLRCLNDSYGGLDPQNLDLLFSTTIYAFQDVLDLRTLLPIATTAIAYFTVSFYLLAFAVIFLTLGFSKRIPFGNLVERALLTLRLFKLKASKFRTRYGPDFAPS